MLFHYAPAVSRATRDAIFLRMRAEGLLGCAMSAFNAPTLADWRRITSPRRGLLLCCYAAGKSAASSENTSVAAHAKGLAARSEAEKLNGRGQAAFARKIVSTVATDDTARAAKTMTAANTATAADTVTITGTTTSETLAPHTGDVGHDTASMLSCALFTPCRGKVWEFDCTTFRTAARLAVPMAHGGLAWAFAHLGCAAIVGLCPTPNRHAWRLAEACGFRVVGRLPQACWHARKQRHVDGVMVLCTPRDLAERVDPEHAGA